MPQFCLLLLQNVDKPLKNKQLSTLLYERGYALFPTLFNVLFRQYAVSTLLYERGYTRSGIQANQLTFAGKNKYRRSCADWSKPTPIKSIIRPSAL